MSDNSDWLEVAGKIAMGVGVGALTVAGALVAKSGAVQSAVARWRRNADKRMVDAPEAGTPLLVSLARDWLKDGTFSIERLEETIRHRMNHGMQIAWLGVRGPTPQFNYALTAEKTARLRDEGLV